MDSAQTEKNGVGMVYEGIRHNAKIKTNDLAHCKRLIETMLSVEHSGMPIEMEMA